MDINKYTHLIRPLTIESYFFISFFGKNIQKKDTYINIFFLQNL